MIPIAIDTTTPRWATFRGSRATITFRMVKVVFWVAVVALCGNVLLFLLRSRYAIRLPGTSPSAKVEEGPPSFGYESPEKAKNSTLGFGEIYYVSLPFRTDRQDAMEIIAALEGFNITYSPGVDGSQIHLKARPSPKTADFKLTNMGCWRAHADVWRKIIRSGVSTALILEDDLNFSVGLRTSIMPKLAEQMQKGLLRMNKPTLSSEGPYGEDWDILSLGTCIEGYNPDYPNAFQAWYDPLAPEVDDPKDVHVLSPSEEEKLEKQGISARTIRFLRPSYTAICTQAYAVTRQGALKMLYNTGVEGLEHPVDLHIDLMLRTGKLMGYTVTPTLFSAWLMHGESDSDNADVVPAEVKHTGKGQSIRPIVNSIREKMAKDLGDEDYVYWAEFKKFYGDGKHSNTKI